jgi:hypothetical protein
MIVPRAAVAVSVRCQLHQQQLDNTTSTTYYLLIQRGNEPNKGLWSLPGGKLEYGETAVQGGMREFNEETIWNNETTSYTDSSSGCSNYSVHFYNGTVCTTDFIDTHYHYLIAHCFAQVTTTTPLQQLPHVRGSDDADDAKWLKLSQVVQDQTTATPIAPGVSQVVQRMEELACRGHLPVTLELQLR